MLAVWLREGALAERPGRGVAHALPAMELIVGATVAVVSLHLLLRAA